VTGLSLPLHAVAALAAAKGPLLIRCTVPGLTPNRAAILRTPSVRPGLSRAGRMRCSSSRRPAEALALTPGPRQASAHALLDHRSLKLGKDAQHLKHGLAAWCRGVQALLMQEEIDPQCMQLGDRMPAGQ
jgi:hypothetical protein